MDDVAICWFRRDLRIADNPALLAAAKKGHVLPIYILDEADGQMPGSGSAHRVWLYQSLKKLNADLGGALRFYKGAPAEILPQICAASGASSVFWNRCYTPYRVQGDANLKAVLRAKNIAVDSFNASLLWEPWQVLKPDGTPYRVFTPFFKKGCLSAEPPRVPLEKPQNIKFFPQTMDSVSLDDLGLMPFKKWAAELIKNWQPGEAGALKAWGNFSQNGLRGYREGRNFPAQKNVSRLSPHLAFGEISPHQIWAALQYYSNDGDIEHFRFELGWREFSAYLLFHFPHMATQNFNPKFDHFPWEKDADVLRRWQRGQTGIPIVDAGMRELWRTGYMHNRVRMIAASFLTKNLLIDWRDGAEWFENCLLDADFASNRASWQWVAGCGADAAPYFRIFNPVLQAEKFDPEGKYIRQFVPELAPLPDKYLFWPHQAPKSLLEGFGIKLGVDYPAPMADLKTSRVRALEVFQQLKVRDLKP